MDKINHIIYQASNGAIELRADVDHETVWASQKQLAEIFGVNTQAITKHINNIYADNELIVVGTCSKMEQVQIEGTKKITRQIKYYNLDMIISIGYRINSKTATHFRQRATQTLKHYITEGYAFNPAMINHNYEQFMKAVNEIKHFLPDDFSQTKEIIDLIETFAQTWLSLNAYDSNKVPTQGATLEEVTIHIEQLYTEINGLKAHLTAQYQAGELFAQEKYHGTLGGILGNILQSYAGEDLYPSIELKAAHLLYFIIKNHPFNDGNKRCGAFAFVRFLQQANINFKESITPAALTTLTILIAQSDPKDKDRLVGLVLMLLNNK